MKLYKFRKIDNEGKYYKGLLDLINTKTLDAKHSSKFNDIFEGKFTIFLDISYYDLIYNTKKFNSLNKDIKNKLTLNMDIEKIKRTPIPDKIKIRLFNDSKISYLKTYENELKEILHNYQKTINILCMSKSWSTNKMWEDYNKHNGVCVEFEFNKSQDLLMNDISYENEIPMINVKDILNYEYFKNKFLFTKSEEYKYEDEFRICTYENTIQMNDVTKIYIGKLVDKEIENKLVKDMQQINPNIEIHRVDLSNSHYKMISKKLYCVK